MQPASSACTQCNAPLSPGVTQCPQCGIQIAAPDALPSPKQTPFSNWKRDLRKSLRLAIILLSSFGFIVLLLDIPRLLFSSPDYKPQTAVSDVATLGSLLQQYRRDNGKFPSNDEGLQALLTKPRGAKNWKGPYATHGLPYDPWGNAYAYRSPGPSGKGFLITSYGSDGSPAGRGDAADITSDND